MLLWNPPNPEDIGLPAPLVGLGACAVTDVTTGDELAISGDVKIEEIVAEEVTSGFVRVEAAFVAEMVLVGDDPPAAE